MAVTPISFDYRHENVLGTSLQLTVHASSEEQAKEAERVVMAEVDRLSSILNTWSPDSEISRAVQVKEGAVSVSRDLEAVLRLCDTWQAKSGGVFSPRVAAFTPVWDQAEKRQAAPTAEELSAVQCRIQKSAWQWEEQAGRIRFNGEAVTLSGIAKDYIVDQAGGRAFASLAASGVCGLLLNIGGDLRTWGETSSTVAIADPHAPAENQTPVSMVQLQDKALATSGGYRRGWKINGKLHSHVIDPRTGLPAGGAASASVIAPDAVTANALAVIFNVLTPEESLALAATIPEVEYLIVRPDQTYIRSAGWLESVPSVVAAVETENLNEKTASPAATAGMELVTTFDLKGGSKRPYVAAWVEDKDGFPVRTLMLWIQQGNKGLKWLPDLKQWYRADKMRRLVDPSHLVDSISSATRRAGQYSVVWDGMDDLGAAVATGEYTLCLEIAREKGTHQTMKHVFAWPGQPFTVDLPANPEVNSVTLESKSKQ